MNPCLPCIAYVFSSINLAIPALMENFVVYDLLNDMLRSTDTNTIMMKRQRQWKMINSKKLGHGYSSTIKLSKADPLIPLQIKFSIAYNYNSKYLLAKIFLRRI